MSPPGTQHPAPTPGAAASPARRARPSQLHLRSAALLVSGRLRWPHRLFLCQPPDAVASPLFLCCRFAGKVYEHVLGDDAYTFVEEVKNPFSCTVLIKGPNDHTISQVRTRCALHPPQPPPPQDTTRRIASRRTSLR